MAGRDKACVVFGIDPGSRTTGYGVVSIEGQKLSYIASGCIQMTQDLSLNDRLLELYQALKQLLEQYQPDEVVIESIFMHRFPGSALTLGHARGVAVLALMEHAGQVHEYAPREVKQAIVGHGNAQKTQVQHMIKSLLSLSAMPPEDAADALALAVCHLHQRTLKKELA